MALCIYATTSLYIYDLMHSYNLAHTYRLLIFPSSDHSYDVTPYGSNAVYIFLYGILWTCTTYTDFII